MTKIQNYIQNLPKAELHLHIEGSFEPQLMFEIAARNNIELPYKSVQEITNAYKFNNLQEFLDIYYQGANVLQKEEDFYELTYAYLKRAAKECIVHTEIFFDPQTHTSRGIPFDVVINGIHKAQKQAQLDFNISSHLILSFLRHLTEEDAFLCMESAIKHRDKFIGIGLDSSELGNPPQKFKRIFEFCKSEGFYLMAHAGEEGPPCYVWDSIEVLKVDRIDHGNKSINENALLERIKHKNMALTLCPLSNLKLKVIKKMEHHPIKEFMNFGIMATINSDDPAYFGGYINANYHAIAEAHNLSIEDIKLLAENSIHASFISQNEKAIYLKQIQNYHQKFIEEYGTHS